MMLLGWKICVTSFLKKTKGSGGTVNRTSVYAEAAVQRDLKRKYYEKFRRIYKKTSVPDLFF